MGLRVGKSLEVKNLLIQSDSKLVIGQINEEYEVKKERMQKYLRLTKHLSFRIDTFHKTSRRLGRSGKEQPDSRS